MDFTFLCWLVANFRISPVINKPCQLHDAQEKKFRHLVLAEHSFRSKWAVMHAAVLQ